MATRSFCTFCECWLSIGGWRDRGRGIQNILSVPPTMAIARCNSARPTLDDVERLSRGRASKKKTGSRAVPHRLNADERKAFEIAKRRGYVLQKICTRQFPLGNTYRDYCDALGFPNVRMEQGLAGSNDEVVVDLSTLRLKDSDLDTLKLKLVEAIFSSPPSAMGTTLDTSSSNDESQVVNRVQIGISDSSVMYTRGQDTPNANDSTPNFTSSKEILRFSAANRNAAKYMCQLTIDTWRAFSNLNLR